MRFLKNGCNEVDRKFLLEMGGSQEWGVGFIMGGWGLLRIFLNSWQRGANPPILWRPTLYCLPPLFQILSNHPPPPTAPSVDLFLWLNGQSCYIWCVILFNDYMDLHMSSLGTLVPEEPSCVFYATRCQVYWGLTHYIVFYWYSDLISHTHKNTNTNTTLKGQ